MKPRAFMIYGPESSGNRLLRRILIAGGCVGDPGLEQSFDQALPMAEDVPLIVWGRSVPGNVPPNSWPSFYVQDIGQARKHGYDVFGLVMVRDWYCMAQSQVDTEFKPAQHIWQANHWSAIAYTRIFDAFDPDKPMESMARAYLELFITRSETEKEKII